MTLPVHIKKAIVSGPVPVVRDWRRLKTDKLTRGERVCRFIESHCVVPEGMLVGKPVRLDQFQIAFILATYDNPHGTKLAILSMARKNAKTATIAFLMLVHLVGPEAKLNSRLNSGAMSRQQASEVYNYASKSANLSPTLSGIVRSVPSQKMLVGLPLNTEYRALSADASTNIGGSPLVAVLDEVGQIKGPQSDFVDAITTAQAAHENPLLIYISTQAPTDADFFSIAIDDARMNRPKTTVCHLYTAERDCSVMDSKQWKMANPALGLFRSEKDMEEQAAKADRMPSFRNTFRNLLLNQRVASFATFVDPEEWRKNNGKPRPLSECQFVFGGLDLSSHRDLTAFVLAGVDDQGMIHVHAKFWTPAQGLEEREKEDKAPYAQWKRAGWLTVIPGATVDYETVVRDIAGWLDDMGATVDAIAFDRWRIDLFKRAADSVGIDLPLVEFGQGFKDMAPALDAVEAAVLAGTLRHGDNPLLNMCAINAVAVDDPAGNRKLEKRKATGRIDGMVALAMAVGMKGKEIETADDISDFISNPIIV